MMGMADYENNLYYNPGASGLEMVATIDWSDGDYQFNYTVVWCRIADGQLFYGEDFEGVESLTAADKDQIMAHVQARNAHNWSGDRSDAIARLAEALHS